MVGDDLTPIGDLRIVRIAALSDNYVWLLHDDASGETVVIDPAEAAPVEAAAAARGWRIGQIWNTHWHPDHTGGNVALKAATGAIVTGPAAEATRIAAIDVGVVDGDSVAIGAHRATVIATPGHTAGHVVFHLVDDAIVFTGDTLFAMGCGRLFEGDADQMFANMGRLAALPGDTIVACGHEYTQSNGRFARSADPDNADVVARMVAVDAARARGDATVPTTIALEKATNPFLRAGSAAALATLRSAKDNFSG